MHDQEAAIQKAAKLSEARKQQLKKNLKPQPGADAAAGTADPELEGPDQAAHTMSRAEGKLEEWQVKDSIFLTLIKTCWCRESAKEACSPNPILLNIATPTPALRMRIVLSELLSGVAHQLSLLLVTNNWEHSKNLDRYATGDRENIFLPHLH